MLTLLGVVTLVWSFPHGIPPSGTDVPRTESLATAVAGADGAATQDAASGSVDELKWFWKDGLRAESADGNFKFRVTGRIFYDNAWYSANDAFDAAGLSTEDGTEFRAARLGVDGSYGEYFYRAEYDFAGDPDFKDVYMGKTDVIGEADVRAGHFKEPMGLDQLTSSLYLTFMERGLPDALVPARNAGIGLGDAFANDHLVWSAGVFRTTDDLGADTQDGGYGLTARLAGAVIQNEAGEPLLHAGVSVTGRDSDDLAISARPESHLTDPWADTGTLASEETLTMGVELATVIGPLHAAAEYVQTDVELASGAAGSDPTFAGYYAQVGWFITGEHRAYNKSQAVFDRTKPAKSWNDKDGGMGAWEAAVRYSNLDLTDEAVSGGELDDVTVGLNWYMNPNMRMMFNYIMSNLENAGFDEDADIFMVRFQVNW